MISGNNIILIIGNIGNIEFACLWKVVAHFKDICNVFMRATLKESESLYSDAVMMN
jgi:hypothetical protein